MHSPRHITVGKELPGYKTFLRSVVVSLLSFIIDFFACMLLVEKANLGYLGAMTISFTVATVVNYILSTKVIFGHGAMDNPGLEFLAFLGIAAVGLVLNGLDMYIFTTLLGIYYLVSRVLAGTLVFFFNYFCRRYLIFAGLGSSLKNLTKKTMTRIKARLGVSNPRHSGC
jgi:putative flippase GtrA